FNKEIHDQPEALLAACVAFVRLANHDPVAFLLCAERMHAALEKLPSVDHDLLAALVHRVRENFYSVQQGDILYWIGVLYYDLSLFEPCLQVFEEYVRRQGMDAYGAVYLGCCHEM